MFLGWVLKRAFKFPSWTVAAICFNNTTALPLLLIRSLDAAGILSQLMMDGDDSTSAALSRAKSYFLVSAIISNSLTFAVGPKLLDDEESPDQNDTKKNRASQHKSSSISNQHADEEPQNASSRAATEEREDDNPTNSGRTAEYGNETMSLLPDSVARHASHYREEISKEGERHWIRLPRNMQIFLGFLDDFLNAPLIGAVIGVIAGLIPPIHRVLFNNPRNGGFFKAWLTESIQNVGALFPALQLVVLGSELGSSLMKRKGEANGSVPWIPTLSIFFIRFIFWPA
jgi:predicted permease